MSVQTELQRIIQAKADIVTSIENKGVTVPAGTKIDNLDDYVDQIQQGGGSAEWAANECLYIENIDTAGQYWNFSGNPANFELYYQLVSSGQQPNDNNWTKVQGTGQNWYSPGMRVYFYGENPTGTTKLRNQTGTDTTMVQFSLISSPKCAVGGNLASIISKKKNVEIPECAFKQLFKGNGSKVTNIDNLIFPDKTSKFCYYQTFYGMPITSFDCSKLRATTLVNYCYSNMFERCTSLTTLTNSLQATSLVNYCYNQMFYGCTSLTSLPNGLLPATSLAQYCYYQMFTSCTSLTSLPSNLLPATTLVQHCYDGMFYGCTSLTSLPNGLLPATSLAPYCYNQMFSSCTGLASLSSNLLPATTLTEGCYYQMFTRCNSLTSLPSGLLPATTMSVAGYYGMFQRCTGLTSVPSDLLPATSLNLTCYYDMFSECTSLTTAPDLPALTLINSCYSQMFWSCTNLNYVKAMFTTNITSSTSYTSGWLTSVSTTGTFVKNANATWSRTDASGIPSGWTVETETPAAA